MPAMEDRQYDCQDSEVVLHIHRVDGVLESVTLHTPGSPVLTVSGKDMMQAAESCGYVLTPKPAQEEEDHAPASHARRRKDADA